MPDPAAAQPNPSPNPSAAGGNPSGVRVFHHCESTPPISPSESWVNRAFSRDELRNDGRLARFKSADDLAVSFISLEKKLRDNPRVAIPGPEATDEQRAEFYRDLGRPEAADKYTAVGRLKDLIPGAQVDERLARGAFDTFHKVGLTDAQATAVVEFFTQEREREVHNLRGTTLNALAHEWGRKNFDSEWAIVYNTVDKLARSIRGLRTFAATPEFGNNLVMVRLFHQIGKMMMGENGARARTSTPAARAADGLAARKAELMRAGSDYWDVRKPGHAAAVAQVQKINQQIAATR